jgi:hypothetical protein
MLIQRSPRRDTQADPETPEAATAPASGDAAPETAAAVDARSAAAADVQAEPGVNRLGRDLAAEARQLQAAVARSATAAGRRLDRRRRVGVLAARIWWKTLKVAFRTPRASALVARLPRRTAGAVPPARRGGELAGAVAVGAAAAYLLDPELGGRRRRRLRGRARATSRRAGRVLSRRTRYAAGQARGAAHGLTSRPRPVADDRTLADRVRTDIFRRADAPKGDVVIGVSDGIVYLRGEVSDQEELERLVNDARKVPGVRDVESLLHTAGTAAPRDGGAA